VINKKKTMYEILEVQPDASYPEIKAAHQRISDNLHAKKNKNNGEEIDFNLKLVNVAFHTLSVPASRNAYDAQLSTLKPPVSVPEQPSKNAVALHADAEALSLRAEAMLLRADAISLRADALAIKSGGQLLPLDPEEKSPSNKTNRVFGRMGSPLQWILVTIGSLTALGMVLQVVFLLFSNRHAEVVSNESAKAEEKMFIQEYFQETGIRVGSRAEAELLDKERRRKENELSSTERAQKRSEDEYRRFVEDSRRRGEQISAEVRAAEVMAIREEEKRKQLLEEEKRNQERAENRRLEKEREKWRRSGYPPSSNNNDQSEE